MRTTKHFTKQLLIGLTFFYEKCKAIHTGRTTTTIPKGMYESLTSNAKDLQPSKICFELEPKRIEGKYFTASRKLRPWHHITDMAAGKTAEQVTLNSTEDNPCSIRIIDFGIGKTSHGCLSKITVSMLTLEALGSTGISATAFSQST